MLNGLRVYAAPSRKALIDFVFERRGVLVAVNAEKIIHATEQTRAIVNDNVGYADGTGAVLGLKSKGLADVIKIPGCELWLDIVRSARPGTRFYIIGGTDEVIERTVYLLDRSFPKVDIVKYRNGYIRTDEERQVLIEDVVETRPDVVFVAMGSPRQEILMEEMNRRHSAVYQGLGGSLDVYVGDVQRAPKWWVKHHLEWLFRLIQQPKRIVRQIHLVRFVWRLLVGRL